jgi:predicted membrane chloride channel (bestrophin family)
MCCEHDIPCCPTAAVPLLLLLLLLLLLHNRTDSSYARWEEALKAWNDVRSLSKDLARQVSYLCDSRVSNSNSCNHLRNSNRAPRQRTSSSGVAVSLQPMSMNM